MIPNALAVAHRKQPRLIPAPAANADRRPLTAAIRITSTVSNPGVTVTTAATTANASIAVSTVPTVTGDRALPL